MSNLIGKYIYSAVAWGDVSIWGAFWFGKTITFLVKQFSYEVSANVLTGNMAEHLGFPLLFQETSYDFLMYSKQLNRIMSYQNVILCKKVDITIMCCKCAVSTIFSNAFFLQWGIWPTVLVMIESLDDIWI